jgi:hypothetical protein
VFGEWRWWGRAEEDVRVSVSGVVAGVVAGGRNGRRMRVRACPSGCRHGRHFQGASISCRTRVAQIGEGRERGCWLERGEGMLVYSHERIATTNPPAAAPTPVRPSSYPSGLYMWGSERRWPPRSTKAGKRILCGGESMSIHPRERDSPGRPLWSAGARDTAALPCHAMQCNQGQSMTM